MSFSLSSGVITQSGTDTDLSGLTALTGVTTITSGGTRIIRLPGYRMVISGTLTIGLGQSLIFDDVGNSNDIKGRYKGQIIINSSGTLNIDGRQIANGVTYYDKSTALFFAGRASGHQGSTNSGDSSIWVRSGGKIVWNGRGVVTGRRLIVEGLITVNEGVYTVHNDVNLLSFSTPMLSLRNATAQTLSNLTAVGGAVSFFTQGAAHTLTGYRPIQSDAPLLLEGGSSPIITINDYSGEGTGADFTFWHNGLFRAVNPKKGGDLRVFGQFATAHQSNIGLVEAYVSTKITCVDPDGATVNECKVYFKDHNDGARTNYVKNFGLANRNENYVNDRIYTASVSAGVTPDISVLIRVWARSVQGGARGVANAGVNAPSNRLSDMSKIPFSVIGYRYNADQIDVPTAGVGKKLVSKNLIVDTNITQSNKTTVNAYTHIQSAQQFYDRAKAWLVDNYAGQSTPLVTRIGPLINAGSLNVVINKTASAAFAVAGNTITIKADTFTGDLKTTGTITMQNGAQSTGSIEDSAGVRVSLRLANGAAFNALARRRDTGAELGFSSGVTSVTYNLPRGTVIDYAVWSLGYDASFASYNTQNGGATITPALTPNANVNAALNVNTALGAITTNLTSTQYKLVFGAALDANLEQMKAIFHRLQGQETSLRALIALQGQPRFLVKDDEIAITSPTVSLERSASLSSTNRVELNGYLSIEVAQTAAGSSATYVPNPSDSNGHYVCYLKVKPVLDPSLYAALAATAMDQNFGQSIAAIKTAATLAAANTTSAP